MNVYIYALVDPRTEEIRYIGKSNDPNRRYLQHISCIGEKNPHKTNWIRLLIGENLLPALMLLEKCHHSVWKERERFWIKRFKDSGSDLLNMTDGGDDISEQAKYVWARRMVQRGWKLKRCFSCGKWTAKINRICTSCLKQLSNGFSDSWYAFYKKDVERENQFAARHDGIMDISFCDLPEDYTEEFDISVSIC